MKKRYIFYIILVLGISYLVYYRITANKKIAAFGNIGGGGPKKDEKGMPVAPPPMVVDGLVVKTTTFNNSLEISGALEANESVMLQSEVAGLVTAINFKEGSSVSKGAVLLKINDREIQAQIQEATTKQQLAASNQGRAKQLLQKGAISQEEYDIALANLKSLKAQGQLLKAQLAKTAIIAPFSGKIGLRSISVGEYLTPSTTIANLLNTNVIKINFSVPEKYVGQIKLNSLITFTTAGTNKTYNGKVFAIEPGINAQTRTLQIKALAQNPNNNLIPGSFAKIKLALSTLNNAILIPNEAVIPVLKGKMVYVCKNGKATPVMVIADTRTAYNILITQGLAIGDTVLTTGTMSLKPDAAVKVNIIKQ